MINVSENHWIPGEGYKYLSNGTVWSEGIYLGKADSINNWHDTNDEPPLPEEEPIPDEEVNANEILGILLGGVDV